ncbi:conserved domain protein [Burkholderia pseudomallei 668]|nr:conserved domain protein [Burkholderia pseudomallei 668]
MIALEGPRIPFPVLCLRSTSRISDCAECIALSRKFNKFDLDLRNKPELLNIVC